MIQALVMKLPHSYVQSTTTQMLKVKVSASHAQLAILALVRELKFLHLANVANIAIRLPCHSRTPLLLKLMETLQ